MREYAVTFLGTAGSYLLHLRKIEAGLRFRESTMLFHNIVVEVPTITKLQHQVKFGLRINNFVKSYNVRVLNKLHAPHLLKQVGS